MYSGCLPCWMIAGMMVAARGDALAAEAGRSDSPPLQLVLLKAAEQPPQPQAAEQVARSRLAASVQQLETFLATGGQQQKERWVAYLGLPLLRAELDRPSPSGDVLALVADRLYANDPGLELQPFVSLRRELSAYLSAREYAQSAEPEKLYRHRL